MQQLSIFRISMKDSSRKQFDLLKVLATRQVAQDIAGTIFQAPQIEWTILSYDETGEVLSKFSREEVLQLFTDDRILMFTGSDGEKHTPIYHYPDGDCDTFLWPFDTAFRSVKKQMEQLTAALFDARECGAFKSSICCAKLPDGTDVTF